MALRPPVSISTVYNSDPKAAALDEAAAIEPVGALAIASSTSRKAAASSCTSMATVSSRPLTPITAGRLANVISTKFNNSYTAAANNFKKGVGNAVKDGSRIPQKVEYPLQCGSVCVQGSRRQESWPSWSHLANFVTKIRRAVFQLGGSPAAWGLRLIFEFKTMFADSSEVHNYAVASGLRISPQRIYFITMDAARVPASGGLAGMELVMQRLPYVQSQRTDIPTCFARAMNNHQVGEPVLCDDELLGVKLTLGHASMAVEIQVRLLIVRWSTDVGDLAHVLGVDDRLSLLRVKPLPWNRKRKASCDVDDDLPDFSSASAPPPGSRPAEPSAEGSAPSRLVEALLDASGGVEEEDDIGLGRAAAMCGDTDVAKELKELLAYGERAEQDTQQGQQHGDELKILEAKVAKAMSKDNVELSIEDLAALYSTPSPKMEIAKGIVNHVDVAGITTPLGHTEAIGATYFRAVCRRHPKGSSNICAFWLNFTQDPRACELALNTWLLRGFA